MADVDPSDIEIMTALERTGFLLEQRVAKCLRDYAFETDIGKAYPDPDTGASREFDVYAVRDEDFEVGKMSPLISVSLVVECKNTPNPFVVIGEKVADYWFTDPVLLSFDPIPYLYPDAQVSSLGGQLRGPRPPAEDSFMGSQLLRMSRKNGNWQADNNAVYDSILYPLAKAVDYEWKSITEIDLEAKNTPWIVPTPYVAYLIPVIVTSGPVYTVDACGDEAEVSKVKWTRLRREFRTKGGSSHLAADLVSFDWLAEYIEKRPLEVLTRARSVLTENARLYEPEWLLAEYGPPGKLDAFRKWQIYTGGRIGLGPT